MKFTLGQAVPRCQRIVAAPNTLRRSAGLRRTDRAPDFFRGGRHVGGTKQFRGRRHVRHGIASLAGGIKSNDRCVDRSQPSVG
jgi:hypothetical protein